MVDSVIQAAPYTQACMYVRKMGTVVIMGLPSSAPFQAPFETLVGKVWLHSFFLFPFARHELMLDLSRNSSYSGP